MRVLHVRAHPAPHRAPWRSSRWAPVDVRCEARVNGSVPHVMSIGLPPPQALPRQRGAGKETGSVSRYMKSHTCANCSWSTQTSENAEGDTHGGVPPSVRPSRPGLRAARASGCPAAPCPGGGCGP